MRRHARCVETFRARVRQVARDRLLAAHQFKQAAQQGLRELPEAARLSLPEGRGQPVREMRGVSMTSKELFFDPKSRQFGLSTFREPFVPHDGFVSISSKTAQRIARKADIVAKMENFLNSGKIEALTSIGDRELGERCECCKDGKYFAFYTDDECFIPMQISAPELYDTHLLEKSQFKAMMLYMVFQQYFDVPLLDKQPEEYIEFSFYDDGTAIDGTGITYRGEGVKPEKVCLVPDILHDERRCKIYTEEERVSVSKFVKDAADFTVSIQKILKRSCPERDESRDMMEAGLIDIYGEPGDWQFNNED